MLQRKKIRPFLNKPTTWGGVPLKDWGYIIGVSFTFLLIPTLLDLSFYGMPLGLIGFLISLVAGVIFFNWARIGRRPRWLGDEMNVLFRDLFGRGHHLRPFYPKEAQQQEEDWLLDYRQNEAKNLWLINSL